MIRSKKVHVFPTPRCSTDILIPSNNIHGANAIVVIYIISVKSNFYVNKKNPEKPISSIFRTFNFEYKVKFVVCHLTNFYVLTFRHFHLSEDTVLASAEYSFYFNGLSFSAKNILQMYIYI